MQQFPNTFWKGHLDIIHLGNTVCNSYSAPCAFLNLTNQNISGSSTSSWIHMTVKCNINTSALSETVKTNGSHGDTLMYSFPNKTNNQSFLNWIPAALEKPSVTALLALVQHLFQSRPHQLYSIRVQPRTGWPSTVSDRKTQWESKRYISEKNWDERMLMFIYFSNI